MNPLELQVLVLLSGVPEASAGTILSYDWNGPSASLQGRSLVPRASAGRRWPGRGADVAGVPRQATKNLWLRIPGEGHVPGAMRGSRMVAPHHAPIG